MYDYIERGRGLEAPSVHLTSEKDTVIILGFYERYEFECLNSLCGTFVFAL